MLNRLGTVISPSSGDSSPTIMRNTVVLPAPFGPMSPAFWPGLSWNEASTNRIWRPYCLETLVRAIMGWSTFPRRAPPVHRYGSFLAAPGERALSGPLPFEHVHHVIHVVVVEPFGVFDRPLRMEPEPLGHGAAAQVPGRGVELDALHFQDLERMAHQRPHRARHDPASLGPGGDPVADGAPFALAIDSVVGHHADELALVKQREGHVLLDHRLRALVADEREGVLHARVHVQPWQPLPQVRALGIHEREQRRGVGVLQRPQPDRLVHADFHGVRTPEGSLFLPAVRVSLEKGGARRQNRIDGGGPDWSRTSGTRFRKPLLYPSELRGHGRATLVHRFDLREQPLALSKLLVRALATVVATFQKRTLLFGHVTRSRPGAFVVSHAPRRKHPLSVSGHGLVIGVQPYPNCSHGVWGPPRQEPRNLLA